MRTSFALYLIYDNYFFLFVGIQCNSIKEAKREKKKRKLKTWATATATAAALHRTIQDYTQVSELHENDNSDMDNKKEAVGTLFVNGTDGMKGKRLKYIHSDKGDFFATIISIE